MLNNSRILCYPGRYSTMADRQLFQRRQKAVKVHKNSGAGSIFLFRAVGAMVVLTMLLGVGSTFWYGHQINLALGDIGRNELSRQELTSMNQQLISERNRLLARENMLVAASRVNLFPPSPGQLR